MSKSIRKEEFIVCAAIFTRLGTHECITLYVNYPKQYTKMQYEVGMSEYVRGFITNKDRFVDQKEALEITGWKNKLHFKDKDHLTPEDLLYFQSLILNRSGIL